MICKVPLPTFLDTLGFQEEKWAFTAGALMGTLALETVAVTAWKTQVRSTGMCMAFQGAPGPRDEAVQPGVLSKAADWEPRSQASNCDCRAYQLGDLALVTPRR